MAAAAPLKASGVLALKTEIHCVFADDNLRGPAYVCHRFKTGGVSVAVISEALGHESEAITQTYLKSFENEVIEKANANLL